MPKKKKRRREETPDAPGMTNSELREIARGRHIHCHEIHGAEMVVHLRRPVRESLGYR